MYFLNDDCTALNVSQYETSESPFHGLSTHALAEKLGLFQEADSRSDLVCSHQSMLQMGRAPGFTLLSCF